MRQGEMVAHHRHQACVIVNLALLADGCCESYASHVVFVLVQSCQVIQHNGNALSKQTSHTVPGWTLLSEEMRC